MWLCQNMISELVLMSNTTCMCGIIHGLQEQIQSRVKGTSRLKSVPWNILRSFWPINRSGRAAEQQPKKRPQHHISQ